MSRISRWYSQNNLKESPGVVANELDCNILVNEFEPQLRYYVHFRTNTLGKDMSPLIPPAVVWIADLLSFNKNSIGIKWPRNVDMK